MTRRAIVSSGRDSLETIQRYMPANYEAHQQGDVVVIEGEDVAGWTLDDYVIPRLASGLIFATEVTDTD